MGVHGSTGRLHQSAPALSRSETVGKAWDGRWLDHQTAPPVAASMFIFGDSSFPRLLHRGRCATLTSVKTAGYVLRARPVTVQLDRLAQSPGRVLMASTGMPWWLVLL